MMNTAFRPGSTKAKLLDRLERSRNDPCYFNEVVLCRSPFWRAQREWAQSVVDYRITAVETGNMLGKGFLIGGLVPWFLWTRKNSLVYVCGAGQTQIGSVLWKEIRRAVAGCPFWKAGLLPMTISPGIKSSPATATIRPGWGAIGFSTSTIERASGHHAANMLVIVDEASGVESAGLAGDRLPWVLQATGVWQPDPSRRSLRRALRRWRQGRAGQATAGVSCRHFNVASTESPHADLDSSPWGMADRTWLEAVGRDPGKDSPWYRSHVLAIRPKLSHDTLIQPGMAQSGAFGGDGGSGHVASWWCPAGQGCSRFRHRRGLRQVDVRHHRER